jgi:hypothetical protein
MPGTGGADGAGSLAVTANSEGGPAEVTATAGKPVVSVVLLAIVVDAVVDGVL